jgi:magnesium chelatase subunit I
MLAQLTTIQGLMEKVRALGLGVSEPEPVRASAAEFILEGLYAHKRISRNEESAFASDGGRNNKAERREAREKTREEDDEFPPRQRRKFN